MSEQVCVEFYAHSANDDGLKQLYDVHKNNVKALSESYFLDAISYYKGGNDYLGKKRVLNLSAEMHDLGKLDEANQAVLRGEVQAPRLPINHKDAGAAFCKSISPESAVLVYSHHGGLPGLIEECNKGGLALRDPHVSSHVDALMQTYKQRHGDVNECVIPKSINNALEYRLLLSTLVDADHTDTAKHFGFEKESSSDCRWGERLTALDDYINSLSSADEAGIRRQQVYDACRSFEPTPIAFCPSPVGSGKTLSTLAYALRCAITKKLRHIIIVAPYVNIIEQTTEVLRDIVVLPNEDPEKIVGSHHHLIDFESDKLRYLTTLWDTPIIVTTSVQFFETLASNKCGRLRKIHQLPGSAVIIDESHDCMPIHLWKLAWKWLQDLANNWSCYFTLASGSMVKFWEFDGFVDVDIYPAQMISNDLYNDLSNAEHSRITYSNHNQIHSEDDLVDFILDKPGPRLVVLNTIKSAAKLSNRLHGLGEDVLFLSTALTPAHRREVIEEVKVKMTHEWADWTLVATSCVECGIDLSFRTGFREISSMNGRIQTGGRVNRNCASSGELYMMELLFDKRDYPDNPSFKNSTFIYHRLLVDTDFDVELPSYLASESVRREFFYKNSLPDTGKAGEEEAKELVDMEEMGDFSKLRDNFRIIKDETILIVVDNDVADSLVQGNKIRKDQIINSTVRMHKNNDIAQHTRLIADDCYRWIAHYDGLLGCAIVMI